MEGQLTPEQIKNWRTVMIGMLGPYAMLMPDEDVQRLRDRFQEIADGQDVNVPERETETTTKG
jgi:hypothetical protein